MTYSDKRKLKNCIDKLRSQEILYSIIVEVETDRYDESDFKFSKDKILEELKKIDIAKFQKGHKVDELEEKLFELLGENFILYIPTESKLIQQMKRLYINKKTA